MKSEAMAFLEWSLLWMMFAHQSLKNIVCQSMGEMSSRSKHDFKYDHTLVMNQNLKMRGPPTPKLYYKAYRSNNSSILKYISYTNFFLISMINQLEILHYGDSQWTCCACHSQSSETHKLSLLGRGRWVYSSLVNFQEFVCWSVMAEIDLLGWFLQ